MELRSTIRDVVDFPKPGIVFKDITTLLQNPEALDESIRQLCAPYTDTPIDQIVGIESRGFIFGAAMARELGCGFVPARKPGKLPAETVSETYTLEYGTDTIEMHRDAIKAGDRVLLVDDLLATGGTAAATIQLIRKLEGQLVGAAFLIELVFLSGREKIKNVPIHTLIQYAAE